MSIFGFTKIALLVFSILIGAASLHGQVKLNIDSVLEVASQIQVKQERLIYFDGVFDFIKEKNISGAEKLLFIRQDLVDEFGEELPSIERAGNACDYFLGFLQTRLADSIINRYVEQAPDFEPLNYIRWLSAKGAIRSDEKKYQEAIRYYELTIPLFEEAKLSSKLKPRILRNYGKNLVAIGRFGDASLALNESIKIGKSIGDSTSVETALLELGILFSQLGLFDEAADYILERQKYIYPPFPLSNAIDQVNLGRNLILQNRYSEAIQAYQRGNQYGPFEGSYSMLPLYVYNGIVESYYFLNQMDSVELYFNKIKKLYVELGESENFEFLYLQSRWLYYMSRGAFPAAEKDGLKLYQQALDKKDNAEILMYSKYFSELYRKSGRYKDALFYTSKYSELRDSIHSANKTQALLLYQTQFETTEKENTILSLKTDNAEQELKVRSNRIRFIAGMIAFLLIGGFFFLRQYYRNKLARTKQLERLRTRISSDLHDDVGSILTGLAMQTELMEAIIPEEHRGNLAKIATMSRTAMAHMRDAVWAMDARNDSWGSLIDRMHEFAHETLEIKNISYQIQCPSIKKDQPLTGAIRQNLFLIFKEALTNITKHSKADRAEINLQHIDGKFTMKISDSGMGMKKEHYSGQGLLNIKMRAEQIGAQAQVETTDGFQIIIQEV